MKTIAIIQRPAASARTSRSGTALCRAALGAVIGAALAALAPASATAGIVYQETFATDTNDLLGSYGYAQSGLPNASYYTAVGGQAVVDMSVWQWWNGAVRLWTTPAGWTHDWSLPLTLSGEVRSTSNTSYGALGVYLGNSSGAVMLGHEVYYVTPGDLGGWILGPGGNRINYSRNSATAIPSGATGMYQVSLKLRENASDSTKFDVLPQLNGVNQITATTTFNPAVSSADGWILGLSKATYFAAGSPSTIGYLQDVGGTLNLDNLTLSAEDPVYEARILTFGKDGNMATIDDGAGTISWTVPHSWVLDGLDPTFTLSPGASCAPASGTANNFEASQDYVVTSGGSLPVQKTYTVTVTKAAPSSACDVLGFSFGQSQPEATIGSNTVHQIVTLITDISLLSDPVITVSPQATITPPTAPVDFTNPQVYRVTAEDGTTYKDYTVTVVSSSTLLLQKSFNTATSDLLTTYQMSQSGLTADKYTASGGIAQVVGDSFKLYALTPVGYEYDWSVPLKFSADVGSTYSGGVGPVLGILLGNGTGTPGAAGFAWQVYWPTPGDSGGFVSLPNNNSRIYYSKQTVIPQNSSAMFNLAVTLRQNAMDSSKFDVLLQVNGINQITDTSTFNVGGVTKEDGWITGLSKATYGINASNPFGTIGMINSGVPSTQKLDNLTLELAPPPVSTTMELVSSANPALAGADVTFTATVLNAGVPAADATGSITFTIDGSTASVAPVVAGQASYTTHALALGSHPVLATYSGNTTYGSSNASLTQVLIDDPYTFWASTIPGFTDTAPANDPDGDGLTNQQEFAFGKNPMDGKSCNPITVPLSPAGTFSYTRLAASGLNHSVWTSTDLETWDGPATVTENLSAPDENGVVTVAVTLTAPPVSDKLFVRVAAD